MGRQPVIVRASNQRQRCCADDDIAEIPKHIFRRQIVVREQPLRNMRWAIWTHRGTGGSARSVNGSAIFHGSRLAVVSKKVVQSIRQGFLLEREWPQRAGRRKAGCRRSPLAILAPTRRYGRCGAGRDEATVPSIEPCNWDLSRIAGGHCARPACGRTVL